VKLKLKLRVRELRVEQIASIGQTPKKKEKNRKKGALVKERIRESNRISPRRVALSD